MSETPQLSTYTPSNTDPEILEKTFVQRHKLLERTVAWCEESILTDKKNHLLLIGPRGSGKTHFISMLINRLKNKPELEEKMVIIWLGEDDVITSLMDLFLLMIENLVKNNPERFNNTCLQQAKGQKPDMVAEIIMHSITEQIGQHTILLVKENMSDVFAGLKDNGQKKLRAFLQEKNNMAILGTSQQLFSGVSSRDAAFFGFFDSHHLKTLTVDEARQLISNIAKLNHNQQLIDFLETPQGCYRIRALHHLAGGNHRLYVELSSFLTMASLDDFVSALTLLADSLTPYFQERVRSLPAQQGRIVQKLCDLQGATPVKMIAEETFIGERSVAKQLGDLAKKGYVISHKRGKQSYYEMAEPLMRLALEVKNSQGKPLKMVALLLRAWFSDTELQTVDEKNGITAHYQTAALSMDKAFLVSINEKIGEQIDIGFDSNDYNKIIAASSEIINGPQTEGEPMVQKCRALYNRGCAYANNNKIELALQDWTTLIEMEYAPAEHKAMALFNRSITYAKKGESEQQFQDLSTLLSMEDAPAEQKAKALFNRSVTYAEKGESERELQDLATLLEMEDAPAEPKAMALFNRSVTYAEKGESERELQDLTTLLEMEDAPAVQKAKALLSRSVTYAEKGENEHPLQDLTTLLEMEDAPAEQKAKALFNRSVTYGLKSENEREIQDLTTLLEMEDAPQYAINKALFWFPVAHFNSLQIKQAQQTLIQAFDKGDKSSDYYLSNTNYILQAINQLGSSFWQDQISWIIPLYAKHKALGNLSSAIIHSASFFIEDESMLSSIKKWQQLWQKHGENYQELQLSLQGLQAVVLTIEQKNDKPLFSLPKEIRELVLPLLSKVLD